MKLISRCLVLALAVVLVLAVIPTADAMVLVLEQEETASLTLEFSDVSAVEGEIIFSDPSVFSEVKYEISGDLKGLVENGIIFLYSDNAAGADGKITVRFTIASNAPQGENYTVAFRYAATAPGSSTPGATQSVTHTVSIYKQEGSATVPTDPPATTTPPETTAPPATTTPPATTKPSTGGQSNTKYADTTALKEQIRIAQGLTYYDYTKQTWSEVELALKNGEDLLGSTSQTAVDNATKSLKDAIANLVPMDYSALQEALDRVGSMENMDAVAEYWERFVQALENARAQMTSGDQAAVDAAAEELLASWSALEKVMAELTASGGVVEVEPSYPFCNKTSHTVILVIMIVSLAVNVALIALIGLHFYKSRKNKRDDTPLVEYDIEDDMGEINEDLLGDFPE